MSLNQEVNYSQGSMPAPDGYWLPNSLKDLDTFTGPSVLVHRETRKIVRTPNGVIIKVGGLHLAEEVLCMRFARDELSLPVNVPRVLHHPGSTRERVGFRELMSSLNHEETMKKLTSVWYICMDEIPGTSLDKVIDRLSDQQLDHIAAELKAILYEISSRKGEKLGSITGDPYRSLLVPFHHQPDRVFDTVGEFSDFFDELLRWHPALHPKERDRLLGSLPRTGEIRFAHGDLLPKNIMVQGSTITGIIDWANAGFYPDWWERYRMYDLGQGNTSPGWSRILETLFPGDCSREGIEALAEILSTLRFP